MIVVVENAIDVTGSLISSLRTASALRHVFDFRFVLPLKGKANLMVENSGFQVQELELKQLSRNTWANLKYIISLAIDVGTFYRYIRRTQPALIINNDFYNLLPGLYRGIGGPVPYVGFVRFLPSKFPTSLVKIWHEVHSKYANRIISVSNAVHNQLPSSMNSIVVYNELPENKVDPTVTLSHLILYPGNYIAGKGQDLALESFAHVSNKHPNWILRFVGGDMGLAKNKAYKTLLIKRAQELGLSNKIEFIDFSHDLSNHYRQAAFAINFSESESFSLTTLEAQFYGRPVVVTRCGGPEEIVRDGETGILVPLKGVTMMSKAIEYLITHPEERHKMGERAYIHVRDKFSYDNTIGRLANIYWDVIKGSGKI